MGNLNRVEVCYGYKEEGSNKEESSTEEKGSNKEEGGSEEKGSNKEEDNHQAPLAVSSSGTH